jgi:uncharacterized membrane protein
MRYSIALHIVALVMWLGSAMIVSRCLRVFCEAYPDAAKDALDQLRAMLKKITYGFLVPGMLLSAISGIYQIIQGGVDTYMKQGWFHTKLTVVIGLIVISVLIIREVIQAGQGQVLSKKKLGILHGLVSLSLIVIVFLTIVGR